MTKKSQLPINFKNSKFGFGLGVTPLIFNGIPLDLGKIVITTTEKGGKTPEQLKELILEIKQDNYINFFEENEAWKDIREICKNEKYILVGSQYGFNAQNGIVDKFNDIILFLASPISFSETDSEILKTKNTLNRIQSFLKTEYSPVIFIYEERDILIDEKGNSLATIHFEEEKSSENENDFENDEE